MTSYHGSKASDSNPYTMETTETAEMPWFTTREENFEVRRWASREELAMMLSNPWSPGGDVAEASFRDLTAKVQYLAESIVDSMSSLDASYKAFNRTWESGVDIPMALDAYKEKYGSRGVGQPRGQRSPALPNNVHRKMFDSIRLHYEYACYLVNHAVESLRVFGDRGFVMKRNLHGVGKLDRFQSATMESISLCRKHCESMESTIRDFQVACKHEWVMAMTLARFHLMLPQEIGEGVFFPMVLASCRPLMATEVFAFGTHMVYANMLGMNTIQIKAENHLGIASSGHRSLDHAFGYYSHSPKHWVSMPCFSPYIFSTWDSLLSKRLCLQVVPSPHSSSMNSGATAGVPLNTIASSHSQRLRTFQETCSAYYSKFKRRLCIVFIETVDDETIYDIENLLRAEVGSSEGPDAKYMQSTTTISQKGKTCPSYINSIDCKIHVFNYFNPQTIDLSELQRVAFDVCALRVWRTHKGDAKIVHLGTDSAWEYRHLLYTPFESAESYAATITNSHINQSVVSDSFGLDQSKDMQSFDLDKFDVYELYSAVTNSLFARGGTVVVDNDRSIVDIVNSKSMMEASEDIIVKMIDVLSFELGNRLKATMLGSHQLSTQQHKEVSLTIYTIVMDYIRRNRKTLVDSIESLGDEDFDIAKLQESMRAAIHKVTLGSKKQLVDVLDICARKMYSIT